MSPPASTVPEFVRPAIRSMRAYQPGEQPQGTEDIVKLNTNENPYPPSPLVFEAIRQALTSDTLRKYPDPQGWGFRRAAGKVLGVEPECIVIANGSDEMLSMLVRAIVPEGGVVVAPTPSYILYQTLANIQGARLQEIPFDADWSLDPRQLEGVGHLTFVANPNSPTGTFIEPNEFRAWPTPLVLDEAYVDFAPADGITLPAGNPHIVVTRSLSKSYSLAGIRFGFAVAHPELAVQLYKVKDSYNCDALALAAATAAIQDQAHLAESRRKILTTRGRLETSLRSLGFMTLPSQANFLWCAHPERPAHEVYRRLKDRGILIRYFNYSNWGDGLRISVGTDPQIDRLLEELAEIIQKKRK
jgi:histidinol-phosphate aminotransferase